MHSTFHRRNGRVGDFLSARFGSLTPPGVRLRPLPITTPITYPSGIYVEINNRDRSSMIEWNSLTVKNVLTRQVDTADFGLKVTNDSTFTVSMGDNVKVYDDQELIFQGVVTRTRTTALSQALKRLSVTCVDYTRELDNKVAAHTYQTQTAEFIIQDLLTRYAPQFTINNVYAPITINYIKFSYQLLSECLQELADYTGYDWYIDQYKDLHFKLASTEAAPFDLMDDNGSYETHSIAFDDDISQLKNSIYLRGGDELATSTTFSEVADGTKKVFTLGYHFSAVPTVTVAAVAKTVGTLGTDNAASFDVLWDPTNDFVQFASAPAAAATVAVTGTPLNPILLYMPEPTSVALYGERQYVIIDKTITTRAGARQRALAEIYRYAQTVTSVRFTTLTSGLRAGQTMHVDSTLFGVDDDYIVTQVETSMRGPTTYEYGVTLISTKLMDIIDLLASMLTSKLKEQTYDTNEGFDPALAIFEGESVVDAITVSLGGSVVTNEAETMADVVTVQALDFGFTPVWGPWTPVGGDNRRVFVPNNGYLN